MSWQLSHGIKVWTGPLPTGRLCIECDAPIAADALRCKGCIQAARDASLAAQITAVPALSSRLCVCGCLVAHGEDCPNCRVWARAAEAVWNRERTAA